MTARSTRRSARPASRIPNARLRKTARELFASALETPGGLKVQTIHALCTRLLQQFPFEANVPARFTVLDDRDQTEMMERANLKVLLEASRDPQSATGQALLTAMASAADVTFKDVVREACLSRDHFMAWTDAAGSVEAAAAQMSAALGVKRRRSDRGRRARDTRRALSAAGAVAGDRRLRSTRGSKTDQKQADAACARRWLSPAARRSTNISCVFLTDDRTPRAAVLTKKIRHRQSCVAPPVRSGMSTHRAADREAARDRDPGPHPRIAPHRDVGGGELSARKGRNAACWTMTT